MFAKLSYTAAVTRKLRIEDRNGDTHEVPTIVEFTIASFATSAEVQMDEAVDQAATAVDRMELAPVLGAEEAVNNVVPIISGIDTMTAAWEPLLNKIKLYTEIVDRISEV
jgi:hypothetical protein